MAVCRATNEGWSLIEKPPLEVKCDGTYKTVRAFRAKIMWRTIRRSAYSSMAASQTQSYFSWQLLFSSLLVFLSFIRRKSFFFSTLPKQNRGEKTLACIQKPIFRFWSEGQSSHFQGNQISIKWKHSKPWFSYSLLTQLHEVCQCKTSVCHLILQTS